MTEVTETTRGRVQRLVENWDWPDPAILEDIIALGEEAVPALIENLTPEMLADAQNDDAANSIVYYSVELLGELKQPAAIPILAGLYPQIGEDDDDLLEAVSDALYKLGRTAITPLLSVVADNSLPPYHRMQACDAATNLAGRDVLRRAQIAAVLRPLLAEYMALPGTLDEDSRLMVAILVDALAEIADLPARPLIAAAFDAGRVGGELHLPNGWPDMPYTNREDIAELFREGGKTDFREPDPFLDRYRENHRKHLAEPPRPGPRPVLELPPDPQPTVLHRKLGRNDPCWCGSGQKYKKCHLAQDEKERVRL